MAEFSFKLALSENIITQYFGHRQSLHYLNVFDKSPETLIAYQTSVLQNEIRNASAVSKYMMGQICNSIDSGFQMLSSHLQETNYKLGEINDQTVYWTQVTTEDEAIYLTGLLNSDAISSIIKDFQPRGAFGERHVHKLPFGVTPPYDAMQAAHQDVVEKTRNLIAEF